MVRIWKGVLGNELDGGDAETDRELISANGCRMPKGYTEEKRKEEEKLAMPRLILGRYITMRPRQGFVVSGW